MFVWRKVAKQKEKNWIREAICSDFTNLQLFICYLFVDFSLLHCLRTRSPNVSKFYKSIYIYIWMNAKMNCRYFFFLVKICRVGRWKRLRRDTTGKTMRMRDTSSRTHSQSYAPHRGYILCTYGPCTIFVNACNIICTFISFGEWNWV